MKTNIRTAKSKLFANATIYYVPSKSGGEEHIVVHNGTYLFCDCRDFMTRHLPLFGTSGFSACTHGRQVIELLGVKKYQVFYGDAVAHLNRGGDTTYSTREEAQALIDNHNKEHHDGKCPLNRVVHEVSKPGVPVKSKPAVKKTIVKTKYAVWVPKLDGTGWFRSAEVEGEFGSRRAAQTALDKHLKHLGVQYDHGGRKVRPI